MQVTWILGHSLPMFDIETGEYYYKDILTADDLRCIENSKEKKMINKNVQVAIESELDYQDRQGAGHIKPDVLIGEQILIMEHNLQRAREMWYKNTSSNYLATLNFIRKVTATGVAIGNRYGMPLRED